MCVCHCVSVCMCVHAACVVVVVYMFVNSSPSPFQHASYEDPGESDEEVMGRQKDSDGMK